MVCERGATAVAVLPTSLLLLSLLCSVTQSVVLSPLSLVVSLDPEEIYFFHCSANGSGRADLKIDGQFFNSREIVDRGIFTTLADVGGGVINTTLVIPATIENNDTDVQCLFYADTDPPSTELSRIGKFYVQGLLEAPGTDIAALNDSFLKFSWTPPFSLDISDSDLDILFYSFSENLTNTAVSVSSVGEFVFLALAVPVEFTVSAWNVVGEGEAAITTHQPCSIPEEQQMVSSAGVRSEVIYQENGRGSLSLCIPWPVGCFPLFSLELAEVERGEGEVVSHDLLLPRVTGSGAEREVHLVVPLEGQDNTHYTAQLVSITDEGVLPAQDKLTYSTHDVQVVEIDFTPNSITTNCQFAVGSLALGCSVYITRQDNEDTPVASLSAMRNSNEQGPLSVEVTAENLESGVYTVTVYDIESNGETKIEDTPAHTETVDITEPTKPTSPPTTSSDTPDMNADEGSEREEETNTLTQTQVVVISISMTLVVCALACGAAVLALLVFRRYCRQKRAGPNARNVVYDEVVLPPTSSSSSSTVIPTEPNAAYATTTRVARHHHSS